MKRIIWGLLGTSGKSGLYTLRVVPARSYWGGLRERPLLPLTHRRAAGQGHDSDHAVFLAGLILSFDSSTNCYLVKYTDGITATLSTDVVKTLLLPPDPVGVSD